MSDENEKLRKTYSLASNLLNEGKTEAQIIEALKNEGLDDSAAANVLSNLNKERNALGGASGNQGYNGGGSGGFSLAGLPRWIIYPIVLIIINLISYLFDLNFWIY